MNETSTVPAARVPAIAPELTVVVPTFNEAKNVPLVVARLDKALAGIAWEVVFVDDDSPDGTAEVARKLAREDGRVRVIRRIGRRGLATACVEGIMSSTAPYFAVMDGDLQHDETRLAEMLRTIKEGDLDIVVGSRYLEGERTEGLSSDWRRFVSKAGGQVAHLVLHADLTDPMSGFFLMSRAAFDREAHALSQRGFKILLDIFASAPKPLRFAEVKSDFGARVHGESKLDTLVAWEYGVLVLDKLVGRFLPVRFVVFAAVGLTGIAVHLATLGLVGAFGTSFQMAQSAAVFVAMSWNFLLNNLITYRDQRLRGAALVRGLVAFYVIGAVGAFANIGIVEMLYGRGTGWWLAGLAGGLIGVVWNYTMSSIFTWRRNGLV